MRGYRGECEKTQLMQPANARDPHTESPCPMRLGIGKQKQQHTITKMKYLLPDESIEFQHFTLRGPSCIAETPADRIAGLAFDPDLHVEPGEPEAAPAPHVGKPFDYSAMTPRWRHKFLMAAEAGFILNPAFTPAAMFEAHFYMIEAGMMLAPRLESQFAPFLHGFVGQFHQQAQERHLSESVGSLIDWAALSGVAVLQLIHDNVPKFTRAQANAALSARIKTGRELDAALAYRLCLLLRKSPGGEAITSSNEKLPEEFERMFRETWSKGLKLQKPSVGISFIHRPAHPWTAQQVSKNFHHYVREGWDFFADAAQFDQLLALYDRWKALPPPKPRITLREATFRDPILQELAAVPLDDLATALDAEIHDAVNVLVENREVAAVMAESHNSGFELAWLDVAVSTLTFDEDSIRVPFSFVLLGQPDEPWFPEMAVGGNAVVTIVPGGRLQFEVECADVDEDFLTAMWYEDQDPDI